MSYHYVCVNFLRVPRTEVNEKICVDDDLVKFSYRLSSICTITTAATYRHLNERADMEGFNERLKQLHASIAQFVCRRCGQHAFAHNEQLVSPLRYVAFLE